MVTIKIKCNGCGKSIPHAESVWGYCKSCARSSSRHSEDYSHNKEPLEMKKPWE